MERYTPKRRWLKSRSRSRRATRGPARPPTTTTSEVRLLTETGRHRHREEVTHHQVKVHGGPLPSPKPDQRPRFLHPRAAPENAPMTMEEALDLWMIVLGMPNEDANPGSFPTAYQGNIISETFLGLNLRDRVTFLAGLTRVTTRVLEVVGGLVGLALSNERGQELVEVPVETAETGLMQTHLNHPHGDGDTPCLDDRWYKVLAELRETLEALNPEGRCAHSLLLLRLLDWRCTNAASGYILGHVHARAGDLLAVLTVAHDDQKYEVDPWKPRDHQVMQDWRKLLDFLPESQGSRAAMGRPLGLGRSAWVQMSVPPGVTYTWGLRSTNNNHYMGTSRLRSWMLWWRRVSNGWSSPPHRSP